SLLDGTPLAEVIERIDGSVMSRPTYYAVNCVHPSVLREALRSDERLRRLPPAAGGVGKLGSPRCGGPGSACRGDGGAAGGGAAEGWGGAGGGVGHEGPGGLRGAGPPPHRCPRRESDGRGRLNRRQGHVGGGAAAASPSPP